MRALAAAVLVAGALVVVAPSAAAAGPSWSVVPAETNSSQDFLLNGVAVPESGDVWAVGYHYETVGGALEFRTLAEHYDGTQFRVVPTPDRETAPAVDMLQDVSGTSATDVWAVGTSLPARVPSQTLIEHWNGSVWTIAPSADPGLHGNDLEGVAAIAPDDVWAVGAEQDDFYQQPMAEHWNGTSWTAVTVPNPSACTGHSYLTAVSAHTGKDVWATGWCGSGGSGGDQGYVEHWNGRRWTLAAEFGTIARYSQLYGVGAVTAHNVWVVGFTESRGSSTGGALVQHYDGTSWTTVAVNAPQDSASLQAVVAGHGHVPWLVGSGTSPQPPFAGPATVRVVGGSGRPVPVPVGFGSLRGVAYDPAGTLWAVGQQLPGSRDAPLVLSRPVG